MSHTQTRARRPTRSTTTPPALIDPSERVTEGTCPSSRCRAVLALDGDQVPEHPRAGSWRRSRRCPCSGWLARDPRPRRHFYVEGVRFL
jgi:hypothetical protein